MFDLELTTHRNQWRTIGGREDVTVTRWEAATDCFWSFVRLMRRVKQEPKAGDAVAVRERSERERCAMRLCDRDATERLIIDNNDDGVV